ncbi:hypothetical protein ES703_62687 [subsurface metagenome]
MIDLKSTGKRIERCAERTDIGKNSTNDNHINLQTAKCKLKIGLVKTTVSSFDYHLVIAFHTKSFSELHIGSTLQDRAWPPGR